MFDFVLTNGEQDVIDWYVASLTFTDKRLKEGSKMKTKIDILEDEIKEVKGQNKEIQDQNTEILRRLPLSATQIEGSKK